VELRHLRYFVAVAEMENVSRAALKLHVSQPALSRQIRDLEDEIGFSLFERTAKSVRLTDAGRAFLDNARALLQNADDAVTKARAVASAEPTELHVGYSPTPAAEILPIILRAFQRATPNVHVRLHDWSIKDILDGIRDGRLQLGLIAFLSPSQSSKFLTGGFAKGLQHIYGAMVHHVLQFRESLIRRAIGVNNHARNCVCIFNRVCRGENTHLTYQRV